MVTLKLLPSVAEAIPSITLQQPSLSVGDTQPLDAVAAPPAALQQPLLFTSATATVPEYSDGRNPQSRAYYPYSFEFETAMAVEARDNAEAAAAAAQQWRHR